MYGYGVAITHVQSATGWSRTGLSFGATLLTLSFVLTPAIGFLVLRVGPRRTLLIGSALAAAGGLIAATASSLWIFILGAGLMSGVACICSGNVPSMTMVLKWFPTSPTRAMGVVTSAGGAAGVLGPPLAAWFLAVGSSWRTMWLVHSGLAIVGGVTVWLLTSDTPNGKQNSNVDAGAKSPRINDERSQSFLRVMWEPLKMPAFWALTFAGLSGTMTSFVLFAHLPAALQDDGRSAAETAVMIAIMSAASVVTRAGIGFLDIPLSHKIIVAVSLCVLGVGVAIAWFGPHHMLFLYLSSGLIGIAMGPWTLLLLIQLAGLFGYDNYPVVAGTFRAIVIGASSAGPVGAGLLHAASGSYNVVFGACSIICALGALSALAVPGRLSSDAFVIEVEP